MYAIKQTRIARLIVAQTGTYGEQFRRPYNSVLDGTARSQVLNALEESQTITAATLAGVANRFILPTAAPECQAKIQNGWNTPRLRFMMELQHIDMLNSVQSEYIVGYTDHPGMTASGALDPNMVFTVNAINMTSHRQNTSASMGTQVYQDVVDSSSILVNDQYDGLLSPGKLYGLRPEDVYTQIDNRELQQGLGGELCLPGRSLVTTEARKSRRNNAIAPAYAANILNAYLQTSRSDSNSAAKEINEVARASVQSLSAQQDSFMQFLKSRGSVDSNYRFTLGDLMLLDPNVTHPSVFQPVPMQASWQSTLHYAGATSSWGGSDYTTLFAVTLSQSIPGYMLNHNLNKIAFSSNNRGIGGGINTIPTHYRSFAGMVDLSGQIAAFIYRIENELLKDLSHAGMVSFDLDMICDLLGDTEIKISLNGAPKTPFVTPSYCDSLIAPMMTNNNTVLDGIAGDFSSLMDEISDGLLKGNSITSQNLGFV